MTGFSWEKCCVAACLQCKRPYLNAPLLSPKAFCVCEEPLINRGESLPSTLSVIEHESFAHRPARICLALIKHDTPPGVRPGECSTVALLLLIHCCRYSWSYWLRLLCSTGLCVYSSSHSGVIKPWILWEQDSRSVSTLAWAHPNLMWPISDLQC